MPQLPVTLTADDGSTWTISGAPVPWRQLWSKLAWRCARPHAPAAPVAPADAALVTQPLADDTAPVITAPTGRTGSGLPLQRTLAQQNVLTGPDHKKSQRASDLRVSARTEKAASLPSHSSSVKKGELFFFRLQPAVVEGRLMVGLGMAMDDVSGDPDAKFGTRWYQRSQWACALASRRWEWADTPFFKKLPTDNDTTEALRDVLPVQPLLTGKATTNKPRLMAECVRLLEAFCVHRNLVQSSEAREEAGFASDDEDADDEEEDTDAEDSSANNDAEDSSSNNEAAADNVDDSSSDEGQIFRPSCALRAKRSRVN